MQYHIIFHRIWYSFSIYFKWNNRVKAISLASLLASIHMERKRLFLRHTLSVGRKAKHGQDKIFQLQTVLLTISFYSKSKCLYFVFVPYSRTPLLRSSNLCFPIICNIFSCPFNFPTFLMYCLPQIYVSEISNFPWFTSLRLLQK
jgi:hypothetical protein